MLKEIEEIKTRVSTRIRQMRRFDELGDAGEVYLEFMIKYYVCRHFFGFWIAEKLFLSKVLKLHKIKSYDISLVAVLHAAAAIAKRENDGVLYRSLLKHCKKEKYVFEETDVTKFLIAEGICYLSAKRFHYFSNACFTLYQEYIINGHSRTVRRVVKAAFDRLSCSSYGFLTTISSDSGLSLFKIMYGRCDHDFMSIHRDLSLAKHTTISEALDYIEKQNGEGRKNIFKVRYENLEEFMKVITIDSYLSINYGDVKKALIYKAIPVFSHKRCMGALKHMLDFVCLDSDSHPVIKSLCFNTPRSFAFYVNEIMHLGPMEFLSMYKTELTTSYCMELLSSDNASADLPFTDAVEFEHFDNIQLRSAIARLDRETSAT